MRIPNWYKDGSFRYNWRCGLGFLPGIILMGVVCGKTYDIIIDVIDQSNYLLLDL